jgi:hypothetical protein
MWKIECPQCHHLFSVVTEENKELIEDQKGEDIKENAAEKVEDALATLVPFSRRVVGSFGKEVKVDYLTYEYKFKCKDCGNEWTELKEAERIAKG